MRRSRCVRKGVSGVRTTYRSAKTTDSSIWRESARLCAHGYTRPLCWVWREPLARLCGGNSPEEQCAALKAYTEAAVLQGGVEPLRERVLEGMMLGRPAFAQRLRREAYGNARDKKSLRGEHRAAAWPHVVPALEQAKGQSWAEFVNRHGDWGRDAALWLGRRAGRLPLAQRGKLAGGLDYSVVSKAIARSSRRLASDAALQEQLAMLQSQLPK